MVIELSKPAPVIEICSLDASVILPWGFPGFRLLGLVYQLSRFQLPCSFVYLVVCFLCAYPFQQLWYPLLERDAGFITQQGASARDIRDAMANVAFAILQDDFRLQILPQP